MNAHLRTVLCLVLFAAVANCTGSSITSPDYDTRIGDASGEAEATLDVTIPDLGVFDKTDNDVLPDELEIEVLPDGDTGPDLPGDFLVPCTTNGECLSGWCIETPDYGQVCTVICYDECPLPDWTCVVGQTQPDLQYICVPPSLSICEACESKDDCPGATTSCLSIGNDGGRYCSFECAANDDCPPGYSCLPDGSGESKACLPDTGSCICTSLLNGTDRPCVKENDTGTCFGIQTCEGADGWSPCSAFEPSAESCDGQDNDCNGQTDEGLPIEPCQQTNEFGTCSGERACQGSVGWGCSAATPLPEICNALDDDCDGTVDDGFPLKGQPCDLDTDDDYCAYGLWVCAAAGSTLECAGDTPQVETCNDADDDCDGVIDEPFPLKNQPCDSDDQDFCPLGLYVCGPFGDEVVCVDDVNQVETCDGMDNDCNGVTDDGFDDLDQNGVADCVDDDIDGDGDPNDTDCQPSNPEVFHGQVEACNAVDDDCDGTTDEDFVDTDDDGSADCLDIDDDNDAIPDVSDNCPRIQNPNQTDTDLDKTGDACDLDDDDDGVLDECPAEAPAEPVPCDDNCRTVPNESQVDTDDDSQGDACDTDDDDDGDLDFLDCAPTNPWIFHGQSDGCNGLDDNCDYVVDEGFADTDVDGKKDCVDPDDDNDGALDADDCAPLNAQVHPAATEACNNIDDDCDGLIDEGFADLDANGVPDCRDADDDGDGDPDASDCAPSNAAIYHGQEEGCDAIDNNCDGLADEGYADSDLDGVKDCVDPDDDNDGDPDSTDCAPYDATIHAGRFEGCDAIDNDCDGATDEGYTDFDGDDLSDCVDDDDDNDTDPDALDCQPKNGAVSHKAVEVCDGVDNDCDGQLDEGFLDSDGDALRDCADEDDDNDGAVDVSDCQPLDPAVSPLKTERCNGIDDDCDAQVDEAFADLDLDGQADCVDTDDDGDGDPDASDCRPQDPAIHNGAPELCDGLDNNCDGQRDEGYADFDLDGQRDCVDGDDDNDADPDLSDCQPRNAAVYSGATEVCDGVDNNCDGQIDENAADFDHDGVGDCIDDDDDNDGDPDTADCAPLNSELHHNALELCDGVDNNCDGVKDEGFPDFDADALRDCIDADDDNDGDPDATDCQPKNAQVFTSQLEVCDGVDNDCDGAVDEGAGDFDADGVGDCVDPDDDNDADPDASDCEPLNALVFHGAEEACDGIDNNCDGVRDEGFPDFDLDGIRDCIDTDDDNDADPDASDCQAKNAAIFAGADEGCDGLDNDCDGLIDEGFANTDGDALADCVDPDDDNDADPDGTDCRPLDNQIFTGRLEVCDGVDNDCDAQVDEGYQDYDADQQKDCVDPDDDNDGDPDVSDCRPFDAAISRLATEVCNGQDDDCNGLVDEGAADFDHDGVGDCVDADDDGDADPDVTDCKPLDAAIHHAAAETCDGVDNTCDGVVDEGYPDNDVDGIKDCVDPDDDNDGDPDATDCQPKSAAIRHGQPEDCNGQDDDCDGQKDEGFANTDGDAQADCVDPDDDNDADPDTADCRPLDSAFFHGAIETCNGQDDDCDGQKDEGFLDTDADGLRDCVDPDDDNDADPDATDCKPLDATIGHNGTEVCDGLDNDCDTVVDEGAADFDHDGVGDCVDLDDDGDGDPDTADCKPLDPAVGHGITETCNGVDDNCDGQKDEGFVDTDADGLRDCIDDDDDNDDSPDGLDCKPKNPAISPLEAETCNGVDDDCDGSTDEAFGDTDGDASADCVDPDDDNDADPDATDCRPVNPLIHHAANEICDGVDNDCDTGVDEGFTDTDLDGARDCVDTDDDNDGDPDATDCAPLNAAVGHQASDTCNGVDDDCDGVADEGFPNIDSDTQADCVDLDDDNDGDPDASDCKPLDKTIFNGANELCDGIDNDCDGQKDEGYQDLDADGVRDCVDPDDDGDNDADATDCAPRDAAVYHGKTETCNGFDDNCVNGVDEGFPDFDLDTVRDCVDPDDDNDADPDTTDCRPKDQSVSHNALELCDGVDNDCDALIDEGSTDYDSDGVGDCVDTDDDNDGDPDTTDCQPLYAAVHNGATEVCNGIDDNCNAQADEGFPDFESDGLKDCVDPDDDNDGSADADDCKPKNAAVSPDEPETCNGVDDNCNGQVDEGFADHDGDLSKDCVDADDDNDGDPDTADCRPYDSAVGHTRTETCNGVDDDCDSSIDEGFSDTDLDGTRDCVDTDDDNDGIPDTSDNCALIANSDQANADTDALGNACDPDDDNDTVVDAADNCPLVSNKPQTDTDTDGDGDACDADDDNDGSPDALDCKPLDATISPLVVEVCNGKDDDCDSQVDEGFSDFDADGTRDCVDTDDDNDADPDTTDCRPYDASVYHGKAETCDGVDNNCSGAVDEGFPDTDADTVRDCVDTDDDGDGDPDSTDCQPLNGAIAHGKAEVCDGVDNNCSSSVDEGFLDTDADGLKDCVDPNDDNDPDLDATDCAPTDPTRYHGAPEGPAAPSSCNGIDDDCDALVDEGFPDNNGNGTPDCAEVDSDHDGDPDSTDCAPTDPTRYHGKTEGTAAPTTCNGVDDNCNGQTDEGFANFDADAKADCVDTDDDNDGDLDATDCDDFNPNVAHGKTEVCNGTDDNCAGGVDEGFTDTDTDGQKDCIDTDDDNDTKLDDQDNCPLVANTSQLNTDGDAQGNACDTDDDNDGDLDTADNCPLVVNANQLDTNVDGEGDACDTDDDGDGSLDAADCAPLNKNVYPGATESCNGTDDDCDTSVDEGFTNTDGTDQADCVDPDDDNDGRLDGADNCPLLANDNQANFDGDAYGDVCDSDIDGDGDPNTSDCNDYNGAIKTGATEKCNGVDDNCNSQVDEGENLASCLNYYLDADNDAVSTSSFKCYCQATGNYDVRPASSPADCCDADANARPGQAQYFSSPRVSCGGYDYDCSGAENKESTTVGQCVQYYFLGFIPAGCDSSSRTGWKTSAPACGAGATTITGCTGTIYCSEVNGSGTQKCK